MGKWRDYGQVDGENGAEDVRHADVGERVDGDDVEVTETPRRDFLPAATRGAHRRPNLDVFYPQRRRLLSIIPAASNHSAPLERSQSTR